MSSVNKKVSFAATTSPSAPPAEDEAGGAQLKNKAKGTQAVCKQFAASGQCSYGKKCKYVHSKADGAPQQKPPKSAVPAVPHHQVAAPVHPVAAAAAPKQPSHQPAAKAKPAGSQKLSEAEMDEIAKALFGDDEDEDEEMPALIPADGAGPNVAAQQADDDEAVPKRRYNIPWPISKPATERLSKVFPGILFTNNVSPASTHTHPELAVLRALAEERAYHHLNGARAALELAAGAGDGEEPPESRRHWIHDVGQHSGALRAKRAGFKRVWGNSPMLDATDAARIAETDRQIPRISDRRYCHHTVMECYQYSANNGGGGAILGGYDMAGVNLGHFAQVEGEAEPVDRYMAMFIHSLYYIPPLGEPGDIVDVLLTFTAPGLRAVAVVHEFDSVHGTFAGGEASYTVSHDGKVHMQVRGESHAYRHNDLSWLRRSSCAARNGQLVVWRRVARYGDCSLWEFVVTHGHIEVAPPETKTFLASMVDANYYGPLMPGDGEFGHGPFSDADRARFGPAIQHYEEITYSRMYSMGPILLTGISEKVSVPIPKRMLAAMSAYMAGRDHSNATFKLLCQKAKELCNSHSYPELHYGTADAQANAIMVCSMLAFVSGVERDAGIYQQIRHLAPQTTAVDDLKSSVGVPVRKVHIDYRLAAVAAAAAAAALAAYAGRSVAQSRLESARLRRLLAEQQRLAGMSVMERALERMRARAADRVQDAADAVRPPHGGGLRPAPRALPPGDLLGSALGAIVPFWRRTVDVVANVPAVIRVLGQGYDFLCGKAHGLLDGNTALVMLQTPVGAVVWSVVVAPLWEEAAKRYVIEPVARFVTRGSPEAGDLADRVGKIAAGSAFWVFENVVAGRSPFELPLLGLMHAGAAALPYEYGVLLHAAWNLLAVGRTSSLLVRLVTAARHGPRELLLAAFEHADPAAYLVELGVQWGLSYPAATISSPWVVVAGLALLAGAWYFGMPTGDAVTAVARGGVVKTGFPPHHTEYGIDRSTPATHEAVIYRHPVAWLPTTVTRAKPKVMSWSADYKDAGKLPTHELPKFAAAGLCSLATIPVVYAPHPYNTMIAFTNRQGLMHPLEADRRYPVMSARTGRPILTEDLFPVYHDYNPEAVGRYAAFKMRMFEWLFPGVGLEGDLSAGIFLERLDFDVWVLRFPAHSREGLQRAHTAILGREWSHRVGNSSAFSKMETQLVSTPVGIEPKDPRIILSGSEEHKAGTGPANHALSKMLGKSWRYGTEVRPGHFIVYCVGLDARELGLAREHMLRSVPDGEDFESDGIRYDSTRNRALKYSTFDVMKRVGYTSTELDLERATLDTRGRTKDGSKFKVWGRMQSGKTVTTAGNTETNGGTETYVTARCCDKISDADFRLVGSRPEDASQPVYVCTLTDAQCKELAEWFRDNYVCLVGGDDEAERLSRRALKAIHPDLRTAIVLYQKRKIAEMEQLGPRLEMVYREDPRDLTFYSGLFWPTTEGLVYGPLPFRALAKMGYYATAEKEMGGRNAYKLAGVVRGDAIGRLASVNHVPVLGHATRRVIELSEGAPAVSQQQIARIIGDPDKRVTSTKCYEPVLETEFMMAHRYGFYSPEWLAGFVKHLERVPGLPSSYYYPGMAEGIERDTGLALL